MNPRRLFFFFPTMVLSKSTVPLLHSFYGHREKRQMSVSSTNLCTYGCCKWFQAASPWTGVRGRVRQGGAVWERERQTERGDGKTQVEETHSRGN